VALQRGIVPVGRRSTPSCRATINGSAKIEASIRQAKFSGVVVVKIEVDPDRLQVQGRNSHDLA
jgi:hypothetical protein